MQNILVLQEIWHVLVGNNWRNGKIWNYQGTLSREMREARMIVTEGVESVVGRRN